MAEDLRKILAFAKEREAEFIRIVTNNSEKELAKELRHSQKEYEQAWARISAIDKIIKKLYEDKVLGNISEERFHKISADYEAEQRALEARANVLKKTLDTEKNRLLTQTAFWPLSESILRYQSWTQKSSASS